MDGYAAYLDYCGKNNKILHFKSIFLGKATWLIEIVFKLLLCTVDRMGQNVTLELLNKGSPSILNFKEIEMSFSKFEKIKRKFFSIPLYQYLPPAAGLISTIFGVRSNVR